MSDWHPIETAPRDGTEVLLWARDCGHPGDKCRCVMGEYTGGRTNINREEWSGWRSSEAHCDSGYDELQPTHWMPLPAGPT